LQAMLYQIDLKKCVFIDIETIPEYKNLAAAPAIMQELWADKWAQIRTFRYKHVFPGVEMQVATPELLAKELPTAYKEAGIYSEFGRAFCITLGQFMAEDPDSPGAYAFKVKSFYGDNEMDILLDICKVFNSYSGEGRGAGYTNSLVGHNIKEFDIPFLCRRLLINGIPLPPIINVAGLKPWETKQLIDTMDLWKFGDIKSFSSLKLLSAVFNIPSPKEGIDGSMVYQAYLDGRGREIAEYCGRDVVTVARLLQRWRGHSILSDADVLMQFAEHN